jgi:hypothetical protein
MPTPHLEDVIERTIRTDFMLLSLLRGDDYLPSVGSFEGGFEVYRSICSQSCHSKPVHDWAIVKVAHDKELGTVFAGIKGVTPGEGVARHSLHPNLTLAQCIRQEDDEGKRKGNGKGKSRSPRRSNSGGGKGGRGGKGGKGGSPRRGDSRDDESEGGIALAIDEELVVNYLQGLLWVLDTYTAGQPLDYHFICLATSSHRKLLNVDVVAFLQRGVASMSAVPPLPPSAEQQTTGAAERGATGAAAETKIYSASDAGAAGAATVRRALPRFALLTSPTNAPDGRPLCPLAACFCLIPAPLLANVLPPGTPEHALARSIVFSEEGSAEIGEIGEIGRADGADEGALGGAPVPSLFHYVVARETDSELLRLRTKLGNASKAFQQLQASSSDISKQDAARALMQHAGDEYEDSLRRYEGLDIDAVDMRLVDLEVRRRSNSQLEEVEVYGQSVQRAVSAGRGGDRGKGRQYDKGKGKRAMQEGRGGGGKGRGAPTPRGGRGHARSKGGRGGRGSGGFYQAGRGRGSGLDVTASSWTPRSQ